LLGEKYKLCYPEEDDLESSDNQQLIEKPIALHLPATGNGVVNVKIERGIYRCLLVFRFFFAYHVT
jgi:hypothetical protein